jgi:hypothetical protein
MSVKTAVLVAALLVAACSSSGGTASTPPVGQAGSGGAPASGGSDGEEDAASGGSAGSGGAETPDTGRTEDADAGSSDALVDPVDHGEGAAGGKVLMIAGEMPMVGVDGQIHQVLEAKNLEVEDVRYDLASPANLAGKQLVVLSYSLLSSNFKAADFADAPVPIIVMEHNLLPDLGMTAAADHGFQTGVTQITIVSNDPILTAGLSGDVTVYSRVGEFFWGVPGPGALGIATIKGNPARVVTFAYPAGAMMVGRSAPAKRVQIFVAVHAPPPNPTEFLNADGLKLVGAAVDWSIR